MGSHHHEHTDDTYFLDQICMVALSGAFGVICLALYFVQRGMLNRLLGQQFHPFVLASGVALVLIAVVRAGVLWSRSGSAVRAHDEGVPMHDDVGHEHSHAHSHAHGHSHSHAEHSHSHGGPAHSHGDDDCCGHDHGTTDIQIGQSHAFGHTPAPAAHSHAHSHGDAHGHDDHDHAWAPWRYVVLLVPIILFLLGLPSKGPSIDEKDLVKSGVNSAEDAEEAAFGASVAALGDQPWWAFGPIAARLHGDAEAADVRPVDFKRLESMPESKEERDYWKGKSVHVRGRFRAQNERVGFLVRFRIQCCGADATPIVVPVLSRAPLSNIRADNWVEITGRVDFRTDGNGKLKTVLLVSHPNHVRPCNPDVNPYVQ